MYPDDGSLYPSRGWPNVYTIESCSSSKALWLYVKPFEKDNGSYPLSVSRIVLGFS